MPVAGIHSKYDDHNMQGLLDALLQYQSYRQVDQLNELSGHWQPGGLTGTQFK